MKKMTQLSVALTFGLAAVNAQAAIITTSASGSLYDDTYSYEFSITDETGTAGTYSATLVNTSPDDRTPIGSNPTIDLFAFNMNAEYGVDFTIENVEHSWFPSVTEDTWTFGTTGSGVAFSYEGTPVDVDYKLFPTESLTFDFIFSGAFLTANDDPFTAWTGAASSLGTGIGGGEDFGQVAVSFQTLGGVYGGETGEGGDFSDLLASEWDSKSVPVPEPATMLLFGTGLAGLAGVRRRKKK